ncbi:low-specificity L-threonine aldolase [Herpetosiphon llansteffanensis]|uniref:low-specificity L-threonine aldolase n=1 Tax=Herpetosiphon llansteffanensis TaxID=2094568 RepID=UPI000D7BB6E0|nr:low-specificity L-threonine aldolase [Herpetosiphon llansteffanensis]
MIDLRSDTVTKPSLAMCEAMHHAEVGDDVFGDDPTVNQLQRYAAEVVGKEAAIFVPSGTMGNLAALLAHAGRGQELLLGDESHIYHYEAGGASALGGLVFHPIATNAQGELDLAALNAAVRPAYDAHAAQAGVVCLENSHNRCGGTVLSLEYLAKVRQWASSQGLPVHMDGARVFNAAVALGVPASAITQHVDSVQFCLSKGLGAPIGSLVAGSAEFIKKVHRWRKMLGGGMRQVGVVAAAGLIALNEGRERLIDDHVNAKMLAEALSQLPQIELDLASVQTNIIVFGLRDSSFTPEQLAERLRQAGVLIVPFKGRLRAVTHVDVNRDQCAEAASIIADVLQSA